MVNSTQEKILKAATEIFLVKGPDGARMQEIADAAGINKSLLHYYFRNKETLYVSVFNNVVKDLVPAITSVFESDKPLLAKISEFLELYIGFIQTNPLMPHFIITETTRNPERLLMAFNQLPKEPLFKKLNKDILASVEKGEIKPIDPRQLIINMISLSVFPFIARPVIRSFLTITQDEFDKLLEDRKKEVAEFVINSLT